jgi:hypothetical protein
MITHDLINFLANLLDIKSRGEGTFYETPFNFNNHTCITNGYIFFLFNANLNYDKVDDKTNQAIQHYLNTKDDIYYIFNAHSSDIHALVNRAESKPCTLIKDCNVCDEYGEVIYNFHHKRDYYKKGECPICHGDKEIDTGTPTGFLWFPKQTVKILSNTYTVDNFYQVSEFLLKINYNGTIKIHAPTVSDKVASPLLIEINDTKIMMSKAIESNDDIVYSLFNPEITNA